MSRMKRGLRSVMIGLIACISLITGSVLFAAPANAATIVGVCKINVEQAHDSGHKHGTINVVGTATCSVVMSEIYLRITLQNADGRTWTSSKFVDYFNTAQEQDNSAVGCDEGHAGTYRGYMSYVLKAPAGYNPSYASGTLYGPWNASVTCSNANRVASSGADATSTNYEVTVPIYAAP